MNNDSLYFLLPLFKKLAHFGNEAILANANVSTNEFVGAIKNHKEGKIPRSGEFSHQGSTVRYQFHGTGCEMFIDNICVDFDYDFQNDGAIKFSTFGFKKFLQSYAKFLENNFDTLPQIEKILNNSTVELVSENMGSYTM